jgi:NADPH:quinone reductase-like Zn-dependent oxidoreductase
MIELLILISGVIFLWKFGKSTSAVAEGAETKAQVWSEKIIADAVLERQANYEEFTENLKKPTGELKDVVSHETFMKTLRGK